MKTDILSFEVALRDAVCDLGFNTQTISTFLSSVVENFRQTKKLAESVEGGAALSPSVASLNCHIRRLMYSGHCFVMKIALDLAAGAETKYNPLGTVSHKLSNEKCHHMVRAYMAFRCAIHPDECDATAWTFISEFTKILSNHLEVSRVALEINSQNSYSLPIREVDLFVKALKLGLKIDATPTKKRYAKK